MEYTFHGRFINGREINVGRISRADQRMYTKFSRETYYWFRRHRLFKEDYLDGDLTRSLRVDEYNNQLFEKSACGIFVGSAKPIGRKDYLPRKRRTAKPNFKAKRNMIVGLLDEDDVRVKEEEDSGNDANSSSTGGRRRRFRHFNDIDEDVVSITVQESNENFGERRSTPTTASNSGGNNH